MDLFEELAEYELTLSYNQLEEKTVDIEDLYSAFKERMLKEMAKS